MKKAVVISTSLRASSNSGMPADKFIEGNAKLQEAYEMGRNR